MLESIIWSVEILAVRRMIMDTLRWIISILTGCIGIWIGIMNWATIIAVTKTKKTASLAPFFGAILMIIALLLMPIQKPWWIFILPFVIDYSCIFGIINRVIAKKNSDISE